MLILSSSGLSSSELVVSAATHGMAQAANAAETLNANNIYWHRFTMSLKNKKAGQPFLWLPGEVMSWFTLVLEEIQSLAFDVLLLIGTIRLLVLDFPFQIGFDFVDLVLHLVTELFFGFLEVLSEFCNLVTNFGPIFIGSILELASEVLLLVFVILCLGLKIV